ncbi:hypothetical protein ACEQ8H_004067 [Pleosporales sp. CAS-2024a]
MGSAETEVENYFRQNIFHGKYGPVRRSGKLVMERQTVPNNPDSLHRVCAPQPDNSYGYDRYAAFDLSKQIQLANIANMNVNSDYLLYPFLVVEFKADGPQSSGSLWTATNQCLGGASASANMIEGLDSLLHSRSLLDVPQSSNITFSFALSGTEGRLHITWRDKDHILYTQRVQNYMLQRPDELQLFRRHFRNVIDWGKDKRLPVITKALDSIVESNRVLMSAQDHSACKRR